MKRSHYLQTFLLFAMLFASMQLPAQWLKSVVYDFDGLNIDQTSLPEHDFRYNDLSTKVSTNPLAASDMLGDRVLKMNLNWNIGKGSFGRKIGRFIELNPATDKLNFYFYNPTSNNQAANLSVILADDDDVSYTYNIANDDVWKKDLVISGSGGWQFFSLPLNSFYDSNTGGNGIFDMAFTGNKGMVLELEFKFTRASSTAPNAVFYIDMIAFSEGNLPTGNTVFDLPANASNGKCPLGAFTPQSKGNNHLTPQEIEGLFPASPAKHIKYVNWFIQFAQDGGTTANELPGNDVKILLDNGYTPIITLEPMFKGYDRLDPVQPRLSNIINGNYDSYFDAFADKLKLMNDTVIIRLMHEFNGDWYSWSIVHNNQDPNLYVQAFRKVVNRFRARGATKVKWMWCVNANYFPSRAYNWSVLAYPGDAYVDIVATDVYNNHYPEDVPWWMSFKEKAAESYYYLAKYTPNKPLFICELGCRERYSGEPATSQSKAAWVAKLDKELQSTFHKTRALIFFSNYKVYDWRINSSSAALSSMNTNIWSDDYYFLSGTPVFSVTITSPANNSSFTAGSTINIAANVSSGTAIQKVQFYRGTTLLAEDLSAPYSYSWTNAAAGTYQLMAKAITTGGSSKESSKVNVTVNPAGTGDCNAQITPGGPTTFCSGSVLLKASPTSGVSYQWIRNGVAISGATSSTYTASQAGDYQVKISKTGCTDWSAPTKVTINTSLTAKITPGGPTSFCSGGSVKLYANTCSGYTYQWKKNGSDIAGATASTYTATSSGNYQVKIVQGSAIAWSAQLAVTVTSCHSPDSIPEEPEQLISADSASSHFYVSVYPNPTTGLFTFEICLEDMPEEMLLLKVMNSLGQTVYSGQEKNVSGCVKETIELSNELAPGIYILQMTLGKKTESIRVLLTR